LARMTAHQHEYTITLVDDHRRWQAHSMGEE